MSWLSSVVSAEVTGSLPNAYTGKSLSSNFETVASDLSFKVSSSARSLLSQYSRHTKGWFPYDRGSQIAITGLRTSAIIWKHTSAGCIGCDMIAILVFTRRSYKL